MKIIVAIEIGGVVTLAGELFHEARGSRETSVFRYLPQWDGAANNFALAPSMPLRGPPVHTSRLPGARHTSALPGPIMDAAPDSWGRRVIDAQRRAVGLPPANELEYLLTGSDAGRWGALRFLGDDQRPIGSDSLGADLSSLDELSAAVARFERTGNVAPLLARFVAAASSAGGARPKALIVDGERHYIAKFTSATDQNAAVERAEVLALKLAKQAGIEAPEAQILGSRDMPVALIERFDRKIVKGRLQRRHVISAQSFLGAQFADEGDYADLVEQMRAHAEAGQPRELYARVAFNVLVRSTDDHLKNHAFIHAGSGRWRMSPVFDVNPQPERHGQLKTYINGRADATVDNLFSGHEAFGLALEEARQIVEGVADAVARHWRSLAREVGMTRKDIDYYAAAFEHEELRSAMRRLAAMSHPSPRSKREKEKPGRGR